MRKTLRPRLRQIPLRPRTRFHAAVSAAMEALEGRVFLSSSTLTAVSDAYVENNASAGANFGSAPTLNVQNPTSGDTSLAFIKFDISGISRVNTATLNLNGALQNAADPSVTTAVFGVADSTWAEGTINFNNQPAVSTGSLSTATVNSTTPQAYTFDVTSFLQSQKSAGQTLVTLAVESQTPSADFESFSSREGSAPPQLVIDTTAPNPPTANIATPANVTSASAQESVVINFTGPAAINTNTITASNLQISGPNGAAGVGVPVVSGSGANVTATYPIAPPGGASTWTSSDNGSYTVSFQGNQVSDANGSFAAANASLFNVNVAAADTVKPVASVQTPSDITAAGPQSENVTVVYTDNVAVSAGTIHAGDLTVTGQTGTLTATSISPAPGANAATLTATYTVPAPSGGWTAADDGTYTVHLPAGAVADTSGNTIAAATANFQVSIPVPDTTPPVTRSVTAPTISAAGNTPESITVTYTDNVAVNVGSINGSNLTVTGPGGARTVTLASKSPANAPTVTAVYSVAPPAGGWTAANNGNYAVTLAAGAVTDTSNNPVAAGGTNFNVSIAVPDNSPPVASSVSAPAITVNGGSTQTVTVVYSDNVAVNVGTITNAGITVTGPGGALSVTGVTVNPNTNNSLVTATYTIAAPGSHAWSFADNGTYHISVVAGSVKDTSGNGVAVQQGTFDVNLPVPDLTAPNDQIFAPAVTAPGGSTEPITVIYNDNTSVDASTIDNSSLTVTGPNGPLTLLNLSKLPASNGPHVTAIYTFAAPGGAWSAADNGAYNVVLAQNHVKDTSGNPDAGDSTTFSVNATIPDTVPPSAVLTAPDVTASGAPTEVVSVVYTDNVALRGDTIAASNISVSGPGGPLTVTGVQTTGSGKTITADYAVAAPGGAWSAGSNGAYTITLSANSVTDTSNNGVAAATATFHVDATVPDRIPPTAGIFAPSRSAASNVPQTIVVIYSDAGNINASTIAASNISVTGPSGPLTVASVSATPAGNAQNVTASYVITAPSGGWSNSANGTYTVTLNANQVKDVSGNATASATSTFTVNVPKPNDPNDATFNNGSPVAAPFSGEAVATLPGGQIVVVGHQGDATQGQSQGVIELLNANGSLDTSFGSGGIVSTVAGANQAFYAVLVQDPNHFIVAGSGGGFLLQRYDLTGKLDTTFGSAGQTVTNFGSASEAAHALAFGAGGSIVAGGTSAGNFAFARYDANGNLDASFGQAGRQLFDVGSSTDVVGTIVTQPADGKLVAVGGSGSNVVVVRLNANGSADSSFGNSGLVLVPHLVTNPDMTAGDYTEGITLQPDTKILIANRTTDGHFGLIRLNNDGSVDTSFGSGGLATAAFNANDDADTVLLQTSGQILVVGTTAVGNTAQTALAAFDPTGALISSFANGGKLALSQGGGVTPAELHIGNLVSIAFGAKTPSGQLVVGASAQGVSSSSSSTLRRLNVPGAAEQSAQSSETFLGSFGVSGKKNLKLTVTEGATKITLTLTGGSGQAYMAANGLHLIISATAKGAALTITTKGGRATLGNINVSGTLRSLSARTSDLAGTLFASGNLGSVTLGNLGGATIAAAGAISSLALLTLTNGHVLAGANLGADGTVGGSGANADTFAPGVIGTFKVSGAMTASLVGAGVNLVDDSFDGDYTVLGGVSSVIKSISVKSIDASSRFIAGRFAKSAKLGTSVKTATDSHFRTA